MISTTSTPGFIVSNSKWCTGEVLQESNVTYYGNPNEIITHGPPTTQGVSSASVSIGVSAGSQGASANAGYSYTYPISDVFVYGLSIPLEGLAA